MINQRNQPGGESNHFPIDTNKEDLQKILNTEMTRDRDLNRAEKNLPTLTTFLESAVNSGEKHIYDLGSGQAILADGIQDLYNKERSQSNRIIVQRIDILGLKQRKNDKNIPLGGRANGRADIENLKPGLTNTYSIFCMQYKQNAPDIIEKLRSNLKPGCRAYIQFPIGLRSKKLLNEFTNSNKDQNILIYTDQTNPSFASIIFETRKQSEQDTQLKIPTYRAETNIPLYRTNNGEKVKNSELFYHFFAENDPEREELQNIKHPENSLLQP